MGLFGNKDKKLLFTIGDMYEGKDNLVSENLITYLKENNLYDDFKNMPQLSDFVETYLKDNIKKDNKLSNFVIIDGMSNYNVNPDDKFQTFDWNYAKCKNCGHIGLNSSNNIASIFDTATCPICKQQTTYNHLNISQYREDYKLGK